MFGTMEPATEPVTEPVREVPVDPVARMCAAMEELAAEDRSGWSGAARSARMVELAELEEWLHAERMRCAADWDGALAWSEDGACSPVAWLVHRTPTTKGRAAQFMRCACLVRDHEMTAKALAAQEVSSGHVDLIARAVRHREELYADHEDVLLDAARSLPVDNFGAAAKTWRLYADDAQTNAEVATSVERAYVELSPTFGGRFVVDGELDAEAGGVVLAALDARCGPSADGLDGWPRTLAERRAQALVEMCAESMDRAARSGRVPVALDLVVDVATLHDEPLADLMGVSCEIEGVGPVAPETARRLACDAAIARVVMRGQSEVLDLGRRTRVVSRAQRRALVHRDGGCVFPGCDRKPGWCDAHHLVPWWAGGPTDLANLGLLCRRHHVAVHEGGWRLRRGEVPGSWIVESPP